MIKKCRICSSVQHGIHACPLYAYGYPAPIKYQAMIDGYEAAQIGLFIVHRNTARGK